MAQALKRAALGGVSHLAMTRSYRFDFGALALKEKRRRQTRHQVARALVGATDRLGVAIFKYRRNG